MNDECQEEQCDEFIPRPALGRVSRFQDVNISKVANGFLIHVGCKTFVAKTWTEASNGLAEYWADPQAAEAKYTK